MEYDPTNSGALFVNDKGDNPKRPDYSGTLDVEGKEYKIAGWVRESKAGKKFLSLKIELKEQSTTPPVTAQAEVKDDLPF